MSSTRRKLSTVGLWFLLLLACVAAFADLLASDLPLVVSQRGEIVVLPGLTGELSGTEGLARIETADWAVWAPMAGNSALGRVVLGARHTVFLAGGVSLLALGIGLTAGTLAGRGPLFADGLLARSVELTGAIPVLALVVMARAWGNDLVGFVLLVGILRGVRIARLVRGEVLRISGQDFVLAAQALGVSTRGLLRRHILPHALGPALVSAAATPAFVVGLEAALAFVGLGAAGSWGALLGRAAEQPSEAFWPALAIIATTLSLFAVADALDDALSARRGKPVTALRSLGG